MRHTLPHQPIRENNSQNSKTITVVSTKGRQDVDHLDLLVKSVYLLYYRRRYRDFLLVRLGHQHW